MSGCGGAATGPESGVVVREAAPGGAADKAGLRAGDRLLRWESQAAGGPRRGAFGDAFEAGEVEAEVAPRGPLTLHGRRDRQDHAWPIGASDWKLTVDPPAVLAGGRAPDPDAAEKRAQALRAEGSWRDACWLLLQAGAARAQAKDWPRAVADFDQAREIARAAGSLLVEARAWEAQGVAALAARDPAKAAEAYASAVELRRKLGGTGESLGLAMVQARAASVAFQRGDVAAAEDQWTRALRIREREAPESLAVGNCLIGLGAVAGRRGDFETATGHFQRALAIRERLAPGTLEHAQALGNLGIVTRERGDLRAAESLYRRSLEIHERMDPEGPETGTALIHLGVLALDRGEWEAAEAYTRRALRIHEAHGPRSRFVTACLTNLGEILKAQGRLADAESSYRRGLKMAEEVTPEGLDVAENLDRLGDVAAARGQLAQARALLDRSLALYRRLAPGSLETARTLATLSDVTFEQKQLARAWSLQQDALAIRARLAPGSAKEAESLYAMGRILKAQGRPAAAQERWLEAVRALEAQRGRLAHSEQGKTAFGARYSGVFTDLIELMAERGQAAEAFHMLERSRARSFRAMLAERALVFTAEDVPEHLLREQRRCDADHDQLRKRLAAADAVRGGAEVDKLLAELEEVRSRRERIAEAVREASPRLASLQEPEPLDLEGARRALEPGTLLLSWSVGRSRTLLFALAATDGPAARGFQVFTIPAGEDGLRRRIALFRELIARGRAAADDRELLEQGRRLFEDLMGPARPMLSGRRRVLLIPDGPLHAVPFAALVTDVARRQYLGDLQPLHATASVTVYAELEKAHARVPPRQGPALVAFGDPQPAPSLRLAPLPASRLEVEAVTAAYAGAAVVYLGARATEDRAKALARGPRFIHFASHGLLDERFPLDSALVLTPAGGEGAGDGMLQAWEVLERMRIDAELVTLSACESGLGRDMRGEGLIGLSRAFQHAGASSVLASLWAVSDRSTAEWMRPFYAALARGSRRDDAVQAAQAEMRRRPEYAHPFHWAAFQLSGLPN